MKHRSPLVTLAAVAVAFIIMFTVNMLVSPPGGSSAEPAGTSTAPASSAPAHQTTSAVATPSASASESTEDRAFPNKVVYAGRAEDKSGAVAVAVLGDQAAAYFCDGRSIESRLRGTVQGADIALADSAAAPELNPESLQATANGESLDAKPINGDEDL